MKEIDLSSWKRREHFEFFRKSDLPFYNINVNLNIEGLREFANNNSISFNTVMLYLTVKAMNRIENFRYRLRGEQVILHDTLHPSFAHIKSGDDLFGMITVEYTGTLKDFAENVQNAINETTSYFDFTKMKGRDDFVFISPLPWISFTGVDHTISLRKEDAIPRVSWGKYFKSNNEMMLPYNVQVNHMFVDGVHVGRFFEVLENEIGSVGIT